jgi:hypothetical protein
LRAVGRKEPKPTTITTEHGTEREVVEEELPKPYDPDRRREDDDLA